MVLSRGDFLTFFERPITAVILALTAMILIWGVFSAGNLRKRRIAQDVAATSPEQN
jgi:TctA family transporter